MLSIALQNPILAITPSEASALAGAAAKVARHYPMQASAQALDWAGLMMTLITVYGTRAMALRMAPKPAPAAPPAQAWEPQIIQGAGVPPS